MIMLLIELKLFTFLFVTRVWGSPEWRQNFVTEIDQVELIHRTNPQSLVCSESQVQEALVSKHNILRKKQFSTNMLKMQWDHEVAHLAQKWANHCEYKHDASSQRKTSKFGCGQNIARTWPQPKSWDVVIHMWYDEIKDFRFGNEPTGDVGHYTQLVWATSWQLGCAYTDCETFHYYVCDYCPAGNVVPNENKPFIPGPPCSSCLDSCENGLCTNICPYEDKYSNCGELQSATFLCWNVFGPHQRSSDSMEEDCAATCRCSSRIHQNNIASKQHMFNHFQSFPLEEFTIPTNKENLKHIDNFHQNIFEEAFNSQNILHNNRPGNNIPFNEISPPVDEDYLDIFSEKRPARIIPFDEITPDIENLHNINMFSEPFDSQNILDENRPAKMIPFDEEISSTPDPEFLSNIFIPIIRKFEENKAPQHLPLNQDVVNPFIGMIFQDKSEDKFNSNNHLNILEQPIRNSGEENHLSNNMIPKKVNVQTNSPKKHLDNSKPIDIFLASVSPVKKFFFRNPDDRLSLKINQVQNDPSLKVGTPFHSKDENLNSIPMQEFEDNNILEPIFENEELQNNLSDNLLFSHS